MAKISNIKTAMQAHREKMRSKYEEFIQGVAKITELELIRLDGEILQSELHSTEAEIEKLNIVQVQYEHFSHALKDKRQMEQLIDRYLKEIIIYKGNPIVVLFRESLHFRAPVRLCRYSRWESGAVGVSHPPLPRSWNRGGNIRLKRRPGRKRAISESLSD